MRIKYKYTDSELVDGLKTSNNDIIRFIVNDNFKQIKQLVRLNKGTDQDAQDVLQEALIVMFKKVKDSAFKLTSSFNTFLYGIAKLIWLKEISKRSKNKLTNENIDFLEDDGMGIQDLIQKNERSRLFREKYNELSEDCQKVLRMFLMEISIKEITKLMGYSSEQHTRNRRYRCKEALIKRIIESKKYKELGYGRNPVN